MKTLRLVYDSRDSLAVDCEQNLCKARAFVPGASGLDARERCTLEIRVSDCDGHVSVQAEAVWSDPTGVGLELVGLDADQRAELEAFVRNTSPGDAPSEAASAKQGSAELEQPVASTADDDDDAAAGRRIPRNIYERIRRMNNRERDETARHGSLAERVALERTFAGAVWEALLQNPQLTQPEVARIARNGTLPKPLVTTIVANLGWLSSGEVQRALLSNPRCSGAQLDRVLRAMPQNELVRLSQHCPYRAEVRAAASRLVARR
ncbi:MAG: hypothetical protein JW940_27725 [Polyangiaceae bacterium]|nr:hypothetical protein [Polyangiaceae bacterium]